MTNEPDRVDHAGDDEVDIDPYLWDGSGETDPLVAELEASLGPARWAGRAGEAPAVPARVQPRSIGWRSLALAASVAIAAGAGWVLWPAAPRLPVAPALGPGWMVESIAGAPGLDGGVAAPGSRLVAGQWLRTDARSTVRLRGEGVGTVDVLPGSDLRLLKADPGEHRLELAQGSISAFVTTPPKVFFVNTPAATAVDMGCAYKLNVDQAGAGTLYVTLGWVELHADSGEVRVPAGAACRIRAKTDLLAGPCTPWFEDAEPAFVAALDRLDATGGGLEEVLAGARARDSLTLWHLAARLRGADRDQVTARLAALVPPPPGVNPASVDAAGLEGWWGAVRASW